MSLPTRERELKPGKAETIAGTYASLPTRERELKPTVRALPLGVLRRSPRGSAN